MVRPGIERGIIQPYVSLKIGIPLSHSQPLLRSRHKGLLQFDMKYNAKTEKGNRIKEVIEH